MSTKPSQARVNTRTAELTNLRRKVNIMSDCDIMLFKVIDLLVLFVKIYSNSNYY